MRNHTACQVEPCDVFTSMHKGSQSQHVYIDIFSVVASLLGASLAGKRGHCESVRLESGTGEGKYDKCTRFPRWRIESSIETECERGLALEK